MKPILIYGASSFGRLVRALAEDAGLQVAGFIDDVNRGDGVLGTGASLGDLYLCADYDLALAIGYRHLAFRLTLFNRLKAAGFNFPVLLHPRAYVSPRATIGEGSMLMAGANIDAFATLDPMCVVWPGALVSHDCRVGTNTFISPNASICGFVGIGHSSFIGAGSVIVDSSVLPNETFVKAGSRHNGRPKT